MTDAQVMAIGAGVGLVLLVVIGFLYRWRRRRSIAGTGLAVVPMPAQDWTDEDVERLLAALEAPDGDEHEGAFV